MYVFLAFLLITKFKSTARVTLKSDCSWKFSWDVLRTIATLELNVTAINSKSAHNARQIHHFDSGKSIPPFSLSDARYHANYAVIF